MDKDKKGQGGEVAKRGVVCDLVQGCTKCTQSIGWNCWCIWKIKSTKYMSDKS